MKMIFKTTAPAIILTAFSALAALSCSKQESPAQDSGENSPGQCFTLTASLPGTDTKTYLGALDAGKYPTLWQTGDRISLNGFSSLPLDAEQAGKNTASFVFRGGLSSPFNILYPATSSKDTVVFPSVQNYTAGTFDSSATPMWASSTEYKDVSLRHLGSLLRFDIKGKATLRSISISSQGSEALSGSFSMARDAAGLYTGGMTPLADSSPSLTLSFGEGGLALKENESTPIYVAVPAGLYSRGFKAVINATDGKVMVIGFFTAQGRKIEPSKVLHFDEFTFTDGGGDVSYIYTVEDLAALAASSAKKACLMNDLDLSASVWNAIENWSGSFDGMNHSITGVGVEPLFKVSSEEVSLTLDGLSVSGMPVVDVSAGDVSAKDCNFKNFSAPSSTVPVVRLGVCEGSTISFNRCNFLDNTNNNGGGVAIHILSTWTGKLYVNACRFCGNANKQFGCIHTGAPGEDLGGFTGLFNCLFYDNRAAASTTSTAKDGADINLSIRHLVANSTFVSVKEHLCNMNVRCGSMTAYSGGAKGALYVNNIFVNEYDKGYCFSMAAKDKYCITLGGYNRYNKAENPTYSGVTYGASDKNVGTEGSYDAESRKWTWTPSQEDKNMMFSGSGASFAQYLKDNADATYLKSYVNDFCKWLNSLGAFDDDLYGNSRSGGIYWPGCYQGE